MTVRVLVILLSIVFLTGVTGTRAEMSSTNFKIPYSVQSSGGGSESSDNYQMKTTLGQPSPLMDPMEPPFSDSFDLYPGFWYVISALGSTCPGDFDRDKDVDGADLVEYIIDSAGLGLDVFAANFGKTNCPW